MLQLVLLLSALWSISLAAPTSKGEMEVIFVQDKASGAVSVRAWTTDYSRVLGQSCDSKLNDGNFAEHPLTLELDHQGTGSLKYGDKSYKIHSVPEHSGGIVCHRRYNDNFARVNCLLPYYGSIDSVVSPEQDLDCFPPRVPSPKQNATTAAQKRDTTFLIGDGNPHQNWWNTQITDTLTCSGGGCTTGAATSYTLTLGVSIDGGFEGEELPFISGGFSVEQSWTTESNLACTGQPWETVCLWQESVHTAYTVNSCGIWGEESCTGPVVMFAPDNNQDWPLAKGFYCVSGPCRSKGEGWWDKTNAPAGGPECLATASAQLNADLGKNGRRYSDADYYDGYTS